MSTQGILISSDNIDQTLMTSRSANSAPILSLPPLPCSQVNVDQENHRPRNSKSPAKVLKPQIISPRLIFQSNKNENNGKNLDPHDSSDNIRTRNSNGRLNRATIHSTNPNMSYCSKIISNDNEKPIYRSTSTHSHSTQKPSNIKRYTTNPRSSSPSKESPRSNLSPTQFKFPLFPPAPHRSDKFTGTDKIAYKIWMKERAKYEKWESSRILYDTRFSEGNLPACYKIIERLNVELAELSKAIREDECRRIFPEEPPKPAEFCPPNVKEAKQWYQQKVKYEAWENAFVLFQENTAKGDTNACKKLIDIIQMSLYNPNYKSDLSSSQPISSRRHADARSTIITEGEPYISKPQIVKFAPNPPLVSVATTGSQNLLSSTSGLKSGRPKLKPPASWGKPRAKSEDKEKNNEKNSHVSFSHPEVPVTAAARITVDNHTDKNGEELSIHTIDLQLAELNTSLDNFFSSTQL